MNKIIKTFINIYYNIRLLMTLSATTLIFACLTVFFNFFVFPLSASEIRLKAIGNISNSVPDINAQINLYQVAQNIAWLKANDSTNWMYFTSKSFNNCGSLKRYWDAEENQLHTFSFSGLKHLSKTQVFYGYVNYNWDFRKNLNNAIEKNPYSFDPFVLADYTVGNILFHGPEIFAAYNYLVLSNLYLGFSLRYNINRGLKNINSEAEIISREINTSVDLIHRLNNEIAYGISFKPFQTLDITKLVDLKEGITPITRRYRGEFFYREKVSTGDRNAKYDGYIIRPQLSYEGKNLHSVLYFDYYYQWHKIFDGTTFQAYDGYFQAQHICFFNIHRLLLDNNQNTYLFFAYNYQIYNDWAKEPLDELLIFQFFEEKHSITFGGSSNIPNFPLLAAVEIKYKYSYPEQKDYLANKFRTGLISNLQTKIGFEYEYNPYIDIRFGGYYKTYYEDKIWNYYGDYEKTGFTCGGAWKFENLLLEFYGEIALSESNISSNYRNQLNFIIQLKQFL